MTMTASRDGGNVKFGITYGPVSASVTEDPGHARSFHGQLGRLLDGIEGVKDAEGRARDGYERYRRHAGGVSKFTGAALPAFDDQDDEVKGHWVAAFTE